MAFDFVSAGLAAIPTAWKAIQGIGQRRRGEEMARNNIRPVYSRPTEARQSLALSEQSYLNGGMPGAESARNMISASGANSFDNIVQASSSGNDVLDGITKIDYNQNLALGDLAAQEAAFKEGQLANYQNQLGINAGYTDKEFGYNQDQPYQDTAAAASALIGAGNQNLGSALGEGAGLGVTIAQNEYRKASDLIPQPGQTVGNYNPNSLGITPGYSPPEVRPFESRFKPLSAAAMQPLSLTNKKLIFDPYAKKVIPSY